LPRQYPEATMGEAIRMTTPPPAPRKRRPYRPPVVTEIVLDTNEAMLTPCKASVVTSPPCPAPIRSIMPQR
jgi:hypothetical protein